MKRIISTLLLSLVLGVSSHANEASFIEGKTCPSNDLFSRMFDKVCWSLVGSVEILNVGGDKKPSDSLDTPIASCGDSLLEQAQTAGPTFGFWNPSMLIEATRKPMCLMSLGGQAMPISAVRTQGGKRTSSDVKGAGPDPVFYNLHEFKMPLLKMLEMYSGMNCPGDGFVDMDIGKISEINALWNNILLKLVVSWRTLVFSAPGVAEYCATVDCAEANQDDISSLDSNYFCMGCWGRSYPAVGYASNSSVMNTVAKIAANSLTEGHEMGMLPGTMGEDAVCKPVYPNSIPKTQYRMSLFYPKFNNNGAGGCSFPLGQSSFLFGEDKWHPAGGEDFSMMVYSYTDCIVN